MARGDLLHLLALDAFAPPVNQSHFVEATLLSLEQVLVNDAGDVARREKMQVDRSLDRHLMDGVRIGHFFGFFDLRCWRWR